MELYESGGVSMMTIEKGSVYVVEIEGSDQVFIMNGKYMNPQLTRERV
jgi:hypothetical protein